MPVRLVRVSWYVVQVAAWLQSSASALVLARLVVVCTYRRCRKVALESESEILLVRLLRARCRAPPLCGARAAQRFSKAWQNRGCESLRVLSREAGLRRSASLFLGSKTLVACGVGLRAPRPRVPCVVAVVTLRLHVVTWLILPVVICLSQRLSHACLSISTCTVKLRMAH